jgi:putative transcriptional regulator
VAAHSFGSISDCISSGSIASDDSWFDGTGNGLVSKRLELSARLDIPADFLRDWRDCFNQEIQMKNRLRVLRAERKWSQAEVAERLGVSRQTINAVETEKYEPSISLAFKMAYLFETRIEDIFQPDDNSNPET